VVLRTVNQNLLIAGGNHTIIPSAIIRPPRWVFSLWGKSKTTPRYVIPRMQ